MLLEQLVERAQQRPEYDWESYYSWLFSQHAGREATGVRFWLCRKCFSVNVTYLPVRYGKCRGCDLLYLPCDE